MEKFVNNLFLSNELIVYLFVQSILFILLIIAFFNSIFILKRWDFSSTTNLQYNLEKKSYLIILIISFVLFVKLFLFFYFAYTLDKLSLLIPGAMCAAGVIEANDYGNINLILKIFILFFIGIWLIINKIDLLEKNYPHTQKKYLLFNFIFILFLMEFMVEYLYFNNISTKTPVQCCSIIFGVSKVDSNIPFNLSITLLITLFYILYLLNTISLIQKNLFLSTISNIFFLFISYFSVTYFFSTYIYELPTHQCPFCMLQREYNFVGYFIWVSLFLGVFFGITNFFLKILIKKTYGNIYNYSLIFNTIFILICSFYVIRYYLLNGVFL